MAYSTTSRICWGSTRPARHRSRTPPRTFSKWPSRPTPAPWPRALPPRCGRIKLNLPCFNELVAQLFANGSTDQKAAMLNSLLGALSPDQRAKLSALLPGVSGGSVTGAQVTGLSPDMVAQVAQQAEQHNPSIVDHMSSFYAQHPTLVKTLGTAAMMIAMRKIAERHA